MSKMKFKNPRHKRNCKSPTILDMDDLFLLSIKGNESLKVILKKMNISHNGLLTHIKRLEKYGLANRYRLKDGRHREKKIFITKKGKAIFLLLFKDERILQAIKEKGHLGTMILAKEVGIAPKNMIKNLKRLEDNGQIKKETIPAKPRGRIKKYSLIKFEIPDLLIRK